MTTPLREHPHSRSLRKAARHLQANHRSLPFDGAWSLPQLICAFVLFSRPPRDWSSDVVDLQGTQHPVQDLASRLLGLSASGTCATPSQAGDSVSDPFQTDSASHPAGYDLDLACHAARFLADVADGRFLDLNRQAQPVAGGQHQQPRAA